MTHTDTGLLVTTPSDLEVVMTRTLEAPAQLVFDAWTKPELLKRWLGRQGDEMIVCEVNLRPGGDWRFVWRLREGGEMGMGGTYREVAAPARLVCTEAFDPPYFEVMGSGTLNTMTFEETDGKTTMTITSLYNSREARDSAVQTGMETGAAESFDRLAEILRS